MESYIYLDNNATTQPLKEVVAAMTEALTEQFANPSSVHRFGQSVRHEVECARQQVADLIGARSEEITFTSGGTEAINLAIRGTLAHRSPHKRVVTSTVEHSAVQRLCKQLAREGYEIVEVGVDGQGRLDLDALTAAVTDDTALISVMWANNETGVLFDVDAIAAITADRNVPLHLDAVQAVGKVNIDVDRLPVQLLSMSAHKLHGPKGAGALFVRRKSRIRPLLIGGRQERDRRGGTENVPGIVGMGVAAEAAKELTDDDRRRISRRRDQLESRICEAIPIAAVNGRDAPRICNTSNMGFRGLAAEALLMLLSESGVCVSSGSACSSGSLEPSHVLAAMGVEPELAHGSLRFSLSRMTTEDEIEQVIPIVSKVVARLSAVSSA